MTFGARYKCPRCDAIYTREEYDRLESTWIDPQIPELGKTKICSRCGSKFSENRMVLKDYVKLKRGVIVEVSTVDLVMEHNWYDDDWYDGDGYFYETMLWIRRDKDSDVGIPTHEVVIRYKTRNEAVQGHRRIVEALKKGKGYKFTKVTVLTIDYDQLEKIAKKCRDYEEAKK